MKIQKKNLFLWGGGQVDGGVGLGGGQVGCERRIEVYVKIQKKKWGEESGRGEGRGGRVELGGGQGRCNREVKFL